MKKFIALLCAAALVTLCGCSAHENENNPENPSQMVSGESVLSSSGAGASPHESVIASENMTESSAESVSESVPESVPESSAESVPESSGEAEQPDPPSGDPLLIVVSAAHPLPDDYQVTLETVQGNYKMSDLAASAAREMIAAAGDAGYSLMVVSGYRTVETSAQLYNNKVQQLINSGMGEEAAKAEAAKWVAPPGTSEHHTGLAMDIVSSDYFNYYADLEHDFEKFDEFTWLYEHCADYGFILRYPKDKQDVTCITYEPWHYRYVGVENARAIMSSGLCLEEYTEA